MVLKYANASRCGRGLTAANAASGFSGDIFSTSAPIADHTSVAFCTSSGLAFFTETTRMVSSFSLPA